jgi:hypothetical protein
MRTHVISLGLVLALVLIVTGVNPAREAQPRALDSCSSHKVE